VLGVTSLSTPGSHLWMADLEGDRAWWLTRGPGSESYPSNDWVDHDRFIAPSFFNVGAGMSVPVTHSADVYALYVVTVAGSNGAHRGTLFAVGTS
jgi:hypothetical protein